MCGIAGFVGLKDQSQFAPWLRRMLKTIVHRGPDELGYMCDEHIGIATARLSIIDLAHGQQPMSDESKRYWVVFNGEVFNYVELRDELASVGVQFHTTSDTEVLLHALIKWGPAALPRLEGQFAFAFYDRQTKEVLLGRDAFGERPLFYTKVGSAVVFASAIKALFAVPVVPRAIDAAALGRAAQLWVTLPDETCFEQVRALAPGHYARLHPNGDVEVRPYYRLPSDQPRFEGCFDEAVAMTRKLLVESVRRRLRSDVSVGVYLSGGLDSTVIAAIARAETPGRLSTFSLEFEDGAFDESTHQRAVADALGTEHHAVRVGQRDICRWFPDAVWHAETVQFRAAAVPLLALSRLARENDHKVVLCGEGADEAFLGYETFKETLLRAEFRSLDFDARSKRLAEMYPYLPHFRNAELQRFYAAFLEERVPGMFSHEVRFSSGSLATRLLRTETDAPPPVAALSSWLQRLYPDLARCTAMQKAQIIEYTTLLGGYLLSSQGDRMSSANSIETRCPFLDQRVVNFAFTLPDDFRLQKGQYEKFILRKAFEAEVPKSIAWRQKHPYRAPDAQSFLASGEEWVQEILSGENVARAPFLNGDNVARFLKRVRSLDASQIGPREDQAFLVLISSMLLWQRFVEDLPDQGEYPHDKLTRAIHLSPERRTDHGR